MPETLAIFGCQADQRPILKYDVDCSVVTQRSSADWRAGQGSEPNVFTGFGINRGGKLMRHYLLGGPQP